MVVKAFFFLNEGVGVSILVVVVVVGVGVSGRQKLNLRNQKPLEQRESDSNHRTYRDQYLRPEIWEKCRPHALNFTTKLHKQRKRNREKKKWKVFRRCEEREYMRVEEEMVVVRDLYINRERERVCVFVCMFGGVKMEIKIEMVLMSDR